MLLYNVSMLGCISKKSWNTELWEFETIADTKSCNLS